jgi:PAS domain S-box-containing protein
MPQQPVTRNQSRLATSFNQRFHLMVAANQLNLAIAVWDLHRMEVRFSPSLEQLYGFDGSEFRGQYHHFLANVHPADRNPIRNVIRLAAEMGQNFEVDYRIVNKAGETVWLSSKGQVFSPSHGGEGLELVEVIQDVTPRYQACAALAESNAQWNALLQKSDELLLQLDHAAHIFWVSPSSAHVLGYSPDTLIGENILDLVHDSDLHKFLLAFEALQERTLPQSFQHYLRNQSGRYVPVQSTLRLAEELGSFAVLSCREISARVDLESTLECTYAAYTAIVDSSPDLVYRFIPDGTLTFANHAFWDYIGFNHEERVGTHVAQSLLQQDWERLRQTCATLTPDHPSAHCECITQTLKGVRRQACQCQALFDAEGVLLEYQIVGHDLGKVD